MRRQPAPCWFREAISDESYQADMAYVAIGALCLGALVTLAFVCGMSAFDYFHCVPITAVTQGGGEQGTAASTSVVPCRFDPLPVGQAAGLIFGAFAALIGALAGYMAATRRTSNHKTR